MKRKIKWGAVVLGVLVTLLLVQIYRVDIRKEPWNGPSKGVSVYASLDENGTLFSYTFLPENRLVISAEGHCVQLAEYQGRYGNQFFDILWKTNMPNRHWAQDFDYVEKGFRPVYLKINTLENHGQNCQGFAKPGKLVHQYTEFSHKNLKVDDKVFVRIKSENFGNLNLEEVLSFAGE